MKKLVCAFLLGILSSVLHAQTGSASVAFIAPVYGGTSQITSYLVTAYINGVSTGITASGASSPILLTGLTDGTTYTAQVQACNVNGCGPASAPSAPFTPGSSGLASRRSTVTNMPYPRRAALVIADFSLNAADQAALGKFDLVNLGLYPLWGNPASAVAGIRSYHSGNMLISQYTILDEQYTSDAVFQGLINMLNSQNWWLRTAAGATIPANDGNYINITSYMPQYNGQNEPQWAADWYNTNSYFTTGAFDIWYFDNVVAVPTAGTASYYNNGADQAVTLAGVQSAWQAGEAQEWAEAMADQPQLLTEGNTSQNMSAPGLTGKLMGALIECAVGQSWSPYQYGGWSTLMTWYLSEAANLASPQLQEVGACASGTDYATFRFILGATLMGNGFLAYNNGDSYGTGSSLWYDEYNVLLGSALEPAATSTSSTYSAGVSTGLYQNGVWRRDFTNGIALVNSTSSTQTVTLGGTFYEIAGTQDSTHNAGTAVTSVTINATDGYVLCNSACSNYPH